VRFDADQRFPGLDPDVVARAFADPALYAGYPAGPKLAAPEVVAHEVGGGHDDPDVVDLQLRYRFVGDLSSAVRAIVDPSRLSWVERSRHELARRTATFVLHPDHYADRLRCSGTVEVTPDGAGARRVVMGELKVRAPLVAGTVERTIVGDLEAHLRDEVAIVTAFLASPR
jgi:hypothetical protein